MEDGLLNNLNIGFIIQARMKSQRLPGKVLMPMPFLSDESLLLNIVNQLKGLKGKVVVATSINPENDIIEDHAARNNLSVFRGDEQNVLSRFTKIIKEHSFDHIVRLTADNPILDTEVLNYAIEEHINNENDYSYTSGLPLGMNIEVVRAAALLESENCIIEKEDEEHVTLALRRESKFKKSLISVDLEDKSISSLRLTVDTEIDYAQLSLIISYGQKNMLSGIKLIAAFNKEYPQLLDLNKSLPQKNSSIDFTKERENAINLLSNLEYTRVVKILKDG